MIHYIKGELQYVGIDRVVVESGGVGFLIFVPTPLLGGLPHLYNEVKIYTYMNVKEDEMSLYGFSSEEELEMFEMLIKVNGVGPKAGLAILSALDFDMLKRAIVSDDVGAIAKAQGVGKKTAQKVILELKDRINTMDVLVGTKSNAGSAGATQNGETSEAVEALVALGYSPTTAYNAVQAVEITDDMDVNAILKLALKHV